MTRAAIDGPGSTDGATLDSDKGLEEPGETNRVRPEGPRWDRNPHFADQFSKPAGERRSAALFRFPSPEPPKRRSMPFHEGSGLHNNESVAPIKKPPECDHGEANGLSCSTGFRVALLEERELFSKEKVLGDESGPRTEKQTEQCQQPPILQ